MLQQEMRLLGLRMQTSLTLESCSTSLRGQ
jgi:hypothetical protein